MLTKDGINVKLIKKIMTEKKTTLPPPRNQDCKKVKVESEKVNRLLSNIQMGKITDLYKLIHAGKKIACDRIGVVPKTWKEI